ncbi:MAG: carboxylating nicotinate-nucleotide diphosphorylase [Bacteroidota bacterium]
MTTLESFITQALAEDIGPGDYTALACIPESAVGKAVLLVKDAGILAGVEVAQQVVKQVDPTLEMEIFINDGTPVIPGDKAFTISGSSRSILAAERLLLNCMQRMSGIATIANRLQSILTPYGCRILDTRKTTPNMRMLEKWAVRIGGGTNHRMGLYDMMMIKDNHIDYAGGIRQAIEKANAYIRENGLDIKIEIEARDHNELDQILETGNVHRIMLDNFSIPDMISGVAKIGGKYETEASGGITEATIADYAKTGVNFISVGALTHSVKSLDLSLKAVQ